MKLRREGHGFREVSFYAGLILILLSTLAIPISNHFTKQFAETINATHTVNVFYRTSAEHSIVAGFWADIFALILVAFGKGRSRIGAMFTGSVILVWLVLSV